MQDICIINKFIFFKLKGKKAKKIRLTLLFELNNA